MEEHALERIPIRLNQFPADEIEIHHISKRTMPVTLRRAALLLTLVLCTPALAIGEASAQTEAPSVKRVSAKAKRPAVVVRRNKGYGFLPGYEPPPMLHEVLAASRLGGAALLGLGLALRLWRPALLSWAVEWRRLRPVLHPDADRPDLELRKIIPVANAPSCKDSKALWLAIFVRGHRLSRINFVYLFVPGSLRCCAISVGPTMSA